MHGIIFQELRRYATARMGEQGWDTLLQQAGLPRNIYLAFKSYPDEEVVALVKAASLLLGKPARAILEDFGELIGPNLLRGYRVLTQPHWSVLDVIENVERIHERVRNDPLATPPFLVCRRMDPDTVQVTYVSKRRLCGLGIGFIRGIANEMKQPVEVRESQCMLQGASKCAFEVRRLPSL
jgi:predicted hydrocarbon binding protein